MRLTELKALNLDKPKKKRVQRQIYRPCLKSDARCTISQIKHNYQLSAIGKYTLHRIFTAHTLASSQCDANLRMIWLFDKIN